MNNSRRRPFKKIFKFSTKLIIALAAANILISVITGLITYRIHLSLFNKEISRQYYMTTEQILAQLDSRVNDMYRITDYITLNPSVSEAILDQNVKSGSFERMKVEQMLDKEMYQVRLDAPEIFAIRIYDLKDNILNLGSFSGQFHNLENDYLNEMLTRLEATGGEYVWSRPDKKDFQQQDRDNVVLAGRLMRSIELDTYGRMLILFNTSLFESHLKDLRIHENAEAYLFDEEGRLLYSLNSMEGQRTPVLADMPAEGILVREEQGESYMYTRQQSEKVGFTLVSKVSLTQIQSQSKVILQVAVASAFASLVFLGIIITVISRILLRPMGSLVRGMKHVREGRFDTRIEIRSKDELGYLGESFNNMTAHIETLIYEMYERTINEKEAELKAIQAQLNPHFLYNTLGMFFWKFYMLGDEKSARLITSLSEMLQYSLEPVQQMTTLRDEIKQIHNYLEIQKARYPDSLTAEIDIPEEMLDARVFRLLIQPIVENAFVHAFRNKKTGRRLRITGSLQPEGEGPGLSMVLEISDNGSGMTEETLGLILHPPQEPVNDKRSRIGTGSVIRRIELAYGDPYGVEFESEPGAGTLVRVKLPYRLLESEDI
ncbi:histidine kinase [Paenibacillus sp. MMS20-IR301]|uniref:cache domain-containing sensor histidine kinase n=1 Tax=Paenibacillus sp. MMS20-IR301 TaxID=2895946 RepID=UPI0028E46425|nr:histidine kinase [Paenibacillus sp. MMS20-IR301]WNS42348.1 histidine kinase [Paenibacillus sp. MMS20-IR301]